MPHHDRLNPISWSIVLAVTGTLALTACSSAGELTPSPNDAEDDVSTAATAPGEPTADVAFVCGQLNALEAARWRATVDEASRALGAACEEAGAPVATIARPLETAARRQLPLECLLDALE